MSPVVERYLHAYLRLCAGVVLRARKPRIVGVTGSVGKTTTKEVIAAVLSHAGARPLVGTVLKTPGNLNDNVGLPLAVLGYTGWTRTRGQFARRLCTLPFRALALAAAGRYPDVLVLEYAASAHGDVPRLAALARPTVAVVTAIGPAHLERFGTIERIVREKGALARAVPADGLVVLGADNPYSSRMDAETSARVVKVPGTGRALSDNAARAVGAFFGVPDEIVERAIQETPAVWRRLKAHESGPFTVIDDSISANPLSMTLALTTLAETAGTRRKVAVLGQMAELGPESPDYHKEIGALAHARADEIIGVGALARDYAPHRWFEKTQACIDALPTLLRPGDIVLVKGSQALQMEHLVASIRHLGRSYGSGAHAGVPRHA